MAMDKVCTKRAINNDCTVAVFQDLPVLINRFAPYSVWCSSKTEDKNKLNTTPSG